jgi:L-amino acid N-acyltransferase YncA
MAQLSFRRATAADASEMWAIIEPILATGDTWVFAPPKTPLDRIQMLDYWLSNEKYTYVCIAENQIVGIFFIKENQPDLGNHIANAGYMTHLNWRGRGIGYAMGAYSLEEARRLGFEGMQYNIVIKTNEGAVRLWQRLGFEIVGTLPKVFRHPTLGRVDAYVMFQSLN